MEVPSNFDREVLVVLVIYEMKISASPTFQSLEKALQLNNQRIELLIYDNSPTHQLPPASNFCIINYMHNSNNEGVSIAYNKGLEMAKVKNKKWLWLLDQDDVLAPDSFLTYESIVKSNPTEEVFIPRVRDEKSFLSPFHFKFGGGSRLNEVYPGTYSLDAFYFINSGILISVSTYESTGGYSNDFPLDFSDIDFIIRLRKKTAHVVVLPTIFKHNLSSSSKESISKKLNRFRSYLQAANRFSIFHSKLSRFITYRALLRAIKLSIQYKTLQFFNVFRTLIF